jgi:signal transduction histidine kinase
LDFAKMEVKSMRIQYEPVDLASFTKELVSLFESAFAKGKIELIVDMPPLDEPVILDRDMWEKIVINLLSNALKYTLQGKVTVSLRRKDEYAELVVQDTGVGIPETALPQIFERFYRVENVRGRTHEGTGIGLALTQSLIKQLGGSIYVESKIGEGSAFHVRVRLGNSHLPVDLIRSPRPIHSSDTVSHLVDGSLCWMDINENSTLPHNDAHKRLLVIDDSADMRQYLKRLLAMHWQVVLADNGETALQILQTEQIDVIISDVMMPNVDGFQLVSILRKDPKLKTIPIILLSARAGEEARIEGLEIGASDYLVKPFAPKELIARVRNQLEVVHEYESSKQQIMMQSALDKMAFQKKLQEEFIDTVCHEIRNPLNGMVGCVDGMKYAVQKLETTLQLVNESPLFAQLEDLKEILNNLNICTEQQRVIVDHVLDLSKLENNRVSLNLETFNPKQAISKVVQMFQQKMILKELSLDLDLGDDFHICSDSGRFKQLLINLVSNAIKFTMKGSVTISLTHQPLSNEYIEIQVHVKDTGVGMSQKEICRIFEPFVQANTSITSNFGGTGLGLAICKKLCELMSGKIGVTSEKGKGSDFYFTIVAVRAIEPTLSDNRSDVLASDAVIKAPSQHVLIVEDNAINQKVLARHLKEAGHQYMIASNGLEALALFRENDYDLVFMDIEMPVMGGLEATREIRVYEGFKKKNRAFIVGLSGNARSEQIDAALEAGMDSYITKPYHRETLLKYIRQQHTC